MITAILGRIAPYLAALLLVSALGNWALAHELLKVEQDVGSARQGIQTQAVTDALAGTKAARDGQAKADADTIKQLQGALGNEQKAAKDYQKQLNDLQASIATTNRSIDHDLSITPDAQAWGAMPVPASILADDSLCWWSASADWGTACDSPAGPLGANPGGGY